MSTDRIIAAQTDEELWQQLAADLAQNDDAEDYQAILQLGDLSVALDIESDPGGGFEGGFFQTLLTTNFPNPDHFRFALHHEGWLDEIGKFFGLHEVDLGDPTFSHATSVKATDEPRVHALLSDASLRSTLMNLGNFTFEIVLPHYEPSPDHPSTLQLIIDDAVTEPENLRPIVSAFFRVLRDLQVSGKVM